MNSYKQTIMEYSIQHHSIPKVYISGYKNNITIYKSPSTAKTILLQKKEAIKTSGSSMNIDKAVSEILASVVSKIGRINSNTNNEESTTKEKTIVTKSDNDYEEIDDEELEDALYGENHNEDDKY